MVLDAVSDTVVASVTVTVPDSGSSKSSAAAFTSVAPFWLPATFSTRACTCSTKLSLAALPSAFVTTSPKANDASPPLPPGAVTVGAAVTVPSKSAPSTPPLAAALVTTVKPT